MFLRPPLITVFVCFVLSCAATATEPTQKINELMRAGWEQRDVQPAEQCSDRVFVRRVYLDLVGRIPTVAEVEAFLADQRADRRAQIVAALLASEDYVQHFADIFDTLLMGRTAENKYAERVKHQWRAYLEDVFRQNRPWSDVVAEILLARPDDQNKRGAVWFLFERNNEHQAIAEAIAPAVFGIRIECAQCHDHMIASEIKQAHYWGLVAFFNRSKNQHTKNGPRVAESAIGGFSEFANLSGNSSQNLLTFFAAQTIEEQRPDKDEKQQESDELYEPPKTDGDPRVPKFSRRQKFVDEIASTHSLVSRALVNRIWAMLLGRGIVHPFDEMDSIHAPSHPELLDWLSDDFAASGQDLRRLIRGIVLSDAYQLSSRRPDGVDDPASFAWYLERPLTAEQMSRSIQLAVQGEFKNDAGLVKAFRQQLLEVLPDENTVTVADALFLSNSRALDDYIQSSQEPTHLVPRLLKLPSHAEKADHLFETTLGRHPSEEESAVVIDYLAQRSEDLPSALRQVVWSFLTTAEFRFNH